MVEKENKGSKGINLVLVIFALLFAFLYLVEKFDLSIPVIRPSKEFVSDAQLKLDSISEELNLRMVQIKNLGGRVKELETIQNEIHDDQIKLGENKYISEELFNKRLSYYVRLLSEKDKEIERLQEENTELIARNDSLDKENSNLKIGLDIARKAIADTALRFLNREKELSERSRVLELNNQILNEKVNVAAALHAEGVNVYAINSKGRESKSPNSTSKKYEKIRVNFHLQQNSLTNKEIKVIYLRIIEPTGMVLTDFSIGSGTFNFRGKEIPYTAKQRIFYENSHQTVEFIFTKNTPFVLGQHEIELYSEGYLIGLGSFEVR
ncbi:MAG: hypothetical protein RIR51_1226 [Bacteroidota bacterium]|jgi:predicted RNase H-like nuclease (RuvC/YqgF family)